VAEYLLDAHVLGVSHSHCMHISFLFCDISSLALTNPNLNCLANVYLYLSHRVQFGSIPWIYTCIDTLKNGPLMNGVGAHGEL